MVPAEQLVQSKAETYTVESYNGIIRHFLARFRRKTKCYSKCEKMMEYSLILLMAKRNNLNLLIPIFLLSFRDKTLKTHHKPLCFR